ncbi:hypothetical protein SASPL_114302 [Salvia splendens]|uniref:Protein kinase domain-containing protein n=1 Tax=Salvia splendens TaxID=180675 RepID=A0A8X8Y1L5_SALSN|nr:hypothetical protein SASPL_114302 [Salvia splendens]
MDATYKVNGIILPECDNKDMLVNENFVSSQVHSDKTKTSFPVEESSLVPKLDRELSPNTSKGKGNPEELVQVSKPLGASIPEPPTSSSNEYCNSGNVHVPDSVNLESGSTDLSYFGSSNPPPRVFLSELILPKNLDTSSVQTLEKENADVSAEQSTSTDRPFPQEHETDDNGLANTQKLTHISSLDNQCSMHENDILKTETEQSPKLPPLGPEDSVEPCEDSVVGLADGTDILIDISDRFSCDLLSDIFSKAVLQDSSYDIGLLMVLRLAGEEFARRDVSLIDLDHVGFSSGLMKLEEGETPLAYDFVPMTKDGVLPSNMDVLGNQGEDGQNDFPGGNGAFSTATSHYDASQMNVSNKYEDGFGNIRLPPLDHSLVDFDITSLQIIKNADLEELRELGSGTFGTVYHGKWRGSDVAIKRIKKSCFTGRQSEQERLTLEFWREAEILLKLHHPNVVAFYGVVQDGPGGTLATVTKYMVDGSLRHVLLRKDRHLDRRKRLIIAMDAAFGMEYLHSENIVHFDLKCDNLLVNLKDPSRPICKVGDLGLSKIKRNTLVSGGVRGTLPWTAPELLNGSSTKVSEKVDVFCIGIVLWEILTGEEPYANMHYDGAIIGGIMNNTYHSKLLRFRMEKINGGVKRFREKTAGEDTGDAPLLRDGFPLPDTIVVSEILARLELDTLCTVACVLRAVKSVTIDCLKVDECSINSILGPHLQELNLLKCPSLSYHVLLSIGEKCPNLRVFPLSIGAFILELMAEVNLRSWSEISQASEGLQLNSTATTLEHILAKFAQFETRLDELNHRVYLSFSEHLIYGVYCMLSIQKLIWKNAPENFRKSFVKMLQNLLYLEHLSIKVRGTEIDAYSLTSVDLFLPKTLKSLKMQLVNEQDAALFIEKLGDDGESLRKIANSSMTITSYHRFCGFTLTCLSLVLDVISDRLMASITSSLRLLVELDLEDRQCSEAKVHHDLTNSGLLLLGSCQYLTHLSIVRSRANYPASFKRVNDVGVLVLAESCRGLESVRLGGFSKVTDAGFSSLVHSCHNLKKLEIRNAPLLSDLAFHDMIGAVSPLVELKMVSCNLITSEALAELASSSTLELLDTYNCRSIANTCLDYISRLSKLTSINLEGADITDSGLGALSKGDLPITSLCLRGCTRVTDKGIIRLLNDGIRIKEKLSSLDISNMPGVSDRAIRAVISCTDALTELCMRSCFHVTNETFHILASGKCDGRNLLRKLDISHCIGFSGGFVELLQEGHSFRGLRWLGVAGTYLVKSVASICRLQPFLTVCFEGCEVGCHDGWQYHT